MEQIIWNTEFTEDQIHQFGVAEQFGGSSEEIRKHPDWSSSLMNCWWNAEKDGETEKWLRTISVIRDNPCEMDAQLKVLGSDYEYAYTVSRCIADPNTFSLVTNIPKDANGYADPELLKFMLYNKQVSKGELEALLDTGRYSINDTNSEQLDYLMCEGNKDIKSLYQNIKRVAGEHAYSENRFGPTDEEKRWASYSIVLAMDDMNIRGRQIQIALDYAKGSIEKLVELLRSRDYNLVQYMNKVVAEEFSNNKVDSTYHYDDYGRVRYPIATTVGASSARGHKTALSDWRVSAWNVEDFLKAEIIESEIDWSTMDITDGIDTETGIKIIEAHGFYKFYDQTLRKDKRVILFYNPYNGDVVSVNGAEPDSIACAGVSLTAWREYFHNAIVVHSSSGPCRYANCRYEILTQHDGLFKQYSNISGIAFGEGIDWKKIGFQTMGSFPMPEYFRFFYQDNQIIGKCKDNMNTYYLSSNNFFQISQMINFVIASFDPNYDTDVCPYYTLLKDDPYLEFMRDHGGFYFRREYILECAERFRFVAAYFEMPEDIRQKYFDALCELVDMAYHLTKEEYPDVGLSNILTVDYVKTLHHLYMTDKNCFEDIYLTGLKPIRETSYANWIPWLSSCNSGDVAGLMDASNILM